MADRVKVELELPNEMVEIEGTNLKIKESSKPSKSEAKKSAGGSKSQNQSEDSSGNIGQILKAPVKPPDDLSEDKSPKRGQVRTLIIGFVLIAISLIVWPIFGFSIAVAEALAGAALIAVGTFVRV